MRPETTPSETNVLVSRGHRHGDDHTIAVRPFGGDDLTSVGSWSVARAEAPRACSVTPGSDCQAAELLTLTGGAVVAMPATTRPLVCSRARAWCRTTQTLVPPGRSGLRRRPPPAGRRVGSTRKERRQRSFRRLPLQQGACGRRVPRSVAVRKRSRQSPLLRSRNRRGRGPEVACPRRAQTRSIGVARPRIGMAEGGEAPVV
jgi:hypothetical protein